MKIVDLLKQGGPSFSFEFFPPKDDAGFEQLFQAIDSLKTLRPTYVSVTYGAGGGTRRKTVELTSRIKNQIGLESMAHMTCVGATQEQIGEVLDELSAAGVENVLALRGDPPAGAARFEATEGGFRYANELVSYVRERYDFGVGVAGYPEGHPEATDRHADLMNLKRKVDAGADFVISQLFFDNDDFLRFRESAERAGIRVPIIAGIMPILSVKQIKRFTEMCGARIPRELLRRIEAVEDDPEAVRHVGMYHATAQCDALLAENVAGIHFYTLNRSTATRAIFQFLRAEIEG